MFDLLFQNVKMFDGSGKDAGKCCDVAVSGDKIAAVGDIPATAAQKVIDCTGLCMIPGMIDVHTHSDFALFTAPGREAALMQGVTTEIISACGIGPVPLSGREKKEYLGLMAGIFGDVPTQVDTRSLDAYFRSLPPTGVNVAAQVGHSPLRTAALGTTADVPFTPEAAERMTSLARQAFEEGAVSVSTGMSYFPAAFCDYAELLGLAKAAAEYDAPMTVHRRDEFRRPMPGFDSREEVLSLARDSGAKLVFSHFRTGSTTAGHPETVCDWLEKGIADGLRVYADFYPYACGSTTLVHFLPFYAMQGGYDGILSFLRNPQKFEALVRRMQGYNRGNMGELLAYCPPHPEYLGMTINEIAAARGVEPERAAAELLRDSRLHGCCVGGTGTTPEINEVLNRDFAYFMTRPYYNVGSDTITSNPWPHPRSYGAFAKALRIALDCGTGLSAFAACTAGNAAKLYNLKNRGIIREGYFADLCVFDEKAVGPKSEYRAPKQYAEGVKFVTVNGKLAVSDGKITGARAGCPLRRGI